MTSKYKQIDRRALRRSVIDVPPAPTGTSPTPYTSYDTASQIFWLIGKYADEVQEWGRRHKMRDGQLRNFVIAEPIFASALGIICSRNAGFSWTLDGPARVTSLLQERFENANMGKGWHDLIVKTTIDLCSQDNGAFWEIVRENNQPDGTFLGVNHLDSARCWHTGNVEAPVIYLDRLGRHHLLQDYQVIQFAEMPTPIEGFYGLQYCTLSRLLRNLQIQRNMGILDYEKSSGRNNRQVHLVKGVTTQQMSDAIKEAQGGADAMGFMRYMPPIMVGTLDPKADVGHDTIDLVGPPTDYNPDIWFKQYINLISMAFESDYQEFAPLPGGGLGTGAQSEMLHLKSRGKGPATFMKLITHAINFRILPKNIKFMFDEQDLEAEKSDAEVRAIRAQTRAVRIASGEITPQAARQIAQDEGDLKYEYLQLMQEQDLTQNTTINDETSAESQTQAPGVKPGIPGPNASPVPPGQPGGGAPQPAGNTGNVPGRPNRIPSVRPPTPLSPKMPPNAGAARTKEFEDEVLELFEDKMAAIKAGMDGLILELDEARKPKGMRRVPVRAKSGLIQYIDEIPIPIESG